MDQCITSTTHTNSNDQFIYLKQNVHKRIKKVSAQLQRYGIHSSTAIISAGLRYTGDRDIARCNICNLEVSEWTQDMLPFDTHAQRSPDCSFVRSQLQNSCSELDDQENPVAKRRKTKSNSEQYKYNYRLVEVKTLQEIRRRTFSHWPRHSKPSTEQMVVAGFFGCNVGDRVVCIYCNLICQQWISDTDDPSEVHKTLSPKCAYVQSMLIHPEPSSALILNEVSINNLNNQTPGTNNTNQLRFDPIVYTTPCHSMYSDITKRLESFTRWTHEPSPSVDDLVRAGFFYTGAGSVVTCFYCSGSLQNWGTNDNPVTEHARWFSHCPYARQLCGDELHRKIQEAKRLRQEHDQANQSVETTQNGNTSSSNYGKLQVNDASMVSRYVAARLDLSISQNLLDKDYKLSVVKRCWEDQLQLKQDDFTSDSDVLISCLILKKQIDHIKGNKDNIIIPSVQMKLIREGKQSGSSSVQTISNGRNIEVIQNQPVPTTTTMESTSTEIIKEKLKSTEINSTENTSISNPCIICCQDEKRLACIPCGHFTTCVPCSHALRTCPICRREIEAFVRIYI